MAAVKDYYELLGINKGASPEEIKGAYRKLARRYHPDLNPGDKASEEKFKEINEAYAVLSDQKKRQGYDRSGRSPFEEGGPWYGRSPFEMPGFEDIFGFDLGNIFGDSSGRRESHSRGADLVMGLEVTLEEAFSGATKKITVNRESPCAQCAASGAMESKTCDKCRGSGRIEASRGVFRMSQTCAACGGAGGKITKACRACGGAGTVLSSESLSVKIPAGVDNGSMLRLRGMGNAGYLGGPAGNVNIRISVRPHPLFERKGDDLYLKLPVTFGEAALGAKIEVPAVDGTAVMTLPAGTQGGQRFKLKAKGFPSPARGGKGDLYVDIEIAVPKDMSQSAKDAIKEIDASYRENPRTGMIKK
ncbi:MAG: J domain-containing protein [Thermodesulfovibrionales bacterium]|nr:J domain-containing protein [Thermodesulfovibrionales bacterium]